MRRFSVTLALALAAATAAVYLPACGEVVAPPGANVLLITVETLRADHVGAQRDGVDLTPRLDELKQRSTFFENAFSAAAFTLPSLHTIATGEPPPVHRVRFWTSFGNRFRGPTVASLLKQRGYRTGFFGGHGLLAPYPILHTGFDVWKDRREARASWVREQAMAFLDETGDQPFFLWMHIYEPHTPYAPEEQFADGLADLELYRDAGPAPFPVSEWVKTVPADAADADRLADRLYAAEVRAADAALGDLLDELTARGLAENTVVAVVGDHGESLSWDTGPRWDHGWSVNRQLTHVPLLLSGPGIPKSVVRGDLAAHLDLAPTLVALTGAPPPNGWLGRNLMGTAPAPSHVVVESTVTLRQDEPFFSVTDGAISLRLNPAQGSAALVDDRDVAATPAPFQPDEPPEAALAPLAVWRTLSTKWRARALELNDPGADEGRLSEEQEALLKMAGYLR